MKYTLENKKGEKIDFDSEEYPKFVEVYNKGQGCIDFYCDACPIKVEACPNYTRTAVSSAKFKNLTLKQKENEVKEEYPLNMMDLIVGNRYQEKGDEVVGTFIFDDSGFSALQTDRFKLIEKKLEVIETKFMLNRMDGMDVVGIYRADLDYGSENIVEIKPLNAELTRWEVVK